MAKEKFIISNSSKLLFFVVLNFGEITYCRGTCPSLTSTNTTSFRCLNIGRPLTNCQNPTDGTIVAVSCINAEYSLQEYKLPVCRNGQWSSSVPQCYPINDETLYNGFELSKITLPQTTSYSSCSSLTSSTSTNFKCKHEGKSLKNCKNPIDETTVLILCNPFYEESSLQISPVRLCRNGKWSSNIPECYPSRYAVPSTTSEKSYPLLGGQTSIYHHNCESLSSTESTNVRCDYNGRSLPNCQNPIDGTLVLISCNPQYEESSLRYNSTRVCVNGKWSSAIPQCHSIYGKVPFMSSEQFNSSLNNQASYERVCPSLTSSASTNIRCINKGRFLSNCENAINGTMAFISCNSFYKQPSLQSNPTRICKDGKWSSSIPECYPIYGEDPSKDQNSNSSLDSQLSSICGKSLPRLFKDSSQLFYPWHVGIFNSAKEYLCGGTIVNPKIILTAAHCVTDDNGKINPSDIYFVAAGKYYRNYADVRDKYAQFSEVSQINTLNGYTGKSSYQALDIAGLILKKPFELSIAVQPVCLDLYEETANLDALLNNPGILTGWGSKTLRGAHSEVLKQLIIQYISFRKCYQEVQEFSRSYITSDKICGRPLKNGSSICRGDGGGGLIFKNEVDGRYYIRGIASSGLFDTEDCALGQYAVYTLISRHIEFLRKLVQPYI